MALRGRIRQLVERRLTAQMLSGAPARDPVAVAERLLAIQAQDPRGARLAVRARSRDLHATDVDRALSEERSLLISWLNRGTLHLIRSEDYPLLQALTTPQLRTASRRRLAQEGMSPARAERAAEIVTGALAADGPLTREELRGRLAASGCPVEGQALYHVLFAVSLDGLIVRGPMKGKQHAFALVADWLGPQPKLDREGALAELARRYLAGHGPAGARDLAKWAQINLGDARRGLDSIANELIDATGAGPGDRLVDLRRRSEPAGLPEPKLLGAFEPILLGWSSRAELLGGSADIVTRNGIFHPIALVGGQVAGKWAIAGGEVSLEPFAPIARSSAAALERERDAVRTFLD